MKCIVVAILFATLLAVATADERHKMCCSACKSTYTHAHHLKHSCLHGCRLYSMIYLAHDKSIADSEIAGMCDKSCKSGFTGGTPPGGADGHSACLTGCREQARVFKEHGLDEHGAKMSVMHGLGLAPDMRSVAPFHQRIFDQMRALHQRMMKAMAGAKHAVIQRIQIRIHSLPPGPDGKPRYQVEIHQHRMPFVFGHMGLPFGPKDVNKSNNKNKKHLLGGDDHDKKPHGWHHHGEHHHGEHHHGNHPHGDHHHGNHHGKEFIFHLPPVAKPDGNGAMYRMRHFFTDMSEPAKIALRWSLFALLLASLLCLGWLCCRTCRRARASAAARQQLSLTNALVKKKPCVQSGDIFYVDVNDKKPLIEEDALDESAKRDKEEDA